MDRSPPKPLLVALLALAVLAVALRRTGAARSEASLALLGVGLLALGGYALLRRTRSTGAGGPDLDTPPGERERADALVPVVQPQLDAIGAATRALVDGPGEVTLFVVSHRVITGVLDYRYSIAPGASTKLAADDSVRLRRAIEALGAEVVKATQHDPTPAHIFVTITADSTVRVRMRVE